MESTQIQAECFLSVRDSSVIENLHTHVDNQLIPAMREFLNSGKRDGAFIALEKVSNAYFLIQTDQ